MQIKRLHKNIYKLYTYARTQECLDVYRQKYQHQVKLWEKLSSENVSLQLLQEIVGISRSTYYRHKKILNNLEKGLAPPSKKPKNLNKPRWTELHKQLVLKIRRANPTYGKEKIAIILKRDHAQTISQSTVGRILMFLNGKGLIIRSISALRTKRKRTFKNMQTFGHLRIMKLWLWESVYKLITWQSSKNDITVKHFQAYDRHQVYRCWYFLVS